LSVHWCVPSTVWFSNQDGPEPEGGRQAIETRPVPAITTNSGGVPGFVQTFPQSYQERPSWIFARRGSLVFVVTRLATAV
jgi:hypothetical protein